MKMVTVYINGQEVSAPEGASLLWAALENGIYIPHLCSLKDDEKPEASCRLCFVEIEGYQKPVTACTEKVEEGMVVHTRNRATLDLIKAGFELLMASHRVDCGDCRANGNCELQVIAAWLKVKLETDRLPKLLPETAASDANTDIGYEADKCVLCGRCVRTCRREGSGLLGFTRRGFRRSVAVYPTVNEHLCIDCRRCLAVCPTAALFQKNPG